MAEEPFGSRMSSRSGSSMTNRVLTSPLKVQNDITVAADAQRWSSSASGERLTVSIRLFFLRALHLIKEPRGVSPQRRFFSGERTTFSTLANKNNRIKKKCQRRHKEKTSERERPLKRAGFKSVHCHRSRRRTISERCCRGGHLSDTLKDRSRTRSRTRRNHVGL